MIKSNDFEKLNEQYKNGYVTKEQLKRWVAINTKNSSKGITKEEYKEITGDEHDAE